MANKVPLSRSDQFDAPPTRHFRGLLAPCNQQSFCNPPRAGNQIVFVYGLEQVIKRAFAQRLDRVFMLRRAEDNRELSIFKTIEEFQTRFVGHLNVQKHQVRCTFFDHLVRFWSAGSRLDDFKIGAVLLDLAANRLARRQFIVHNHASDLHF